MEGFTPLVNDYILGKAALPVAAVCIIFVLTLIITAVLTAKQLGKERDRIENRSAPDDDAEMSSADDPA